MIFNKVFGRFVKVQEAPVELTDEERIERLKSLADRIINRQLARIDTYVRNYFSGKGNTKELSLTYEQVRELEELLNPFAYYGDIAAAARTEGLLQDWQAFKNNPAFANHVQARAEEAEERVLEIEPLFYAKIREEKTQFAIFSQMISTRVDYVEQYGSFSAAAEEMYYKQPWVLVYEINAGSRAESLTWYTGVENLYAMPKSIFGWFELNRAFTDEGFIAENSKAQVTSRISEETCRGVASIFNPIDGISLTQALEALMEA